MCFFFLGRVPFLIAFFLPKSTTIPGHAHTYPDTYTHRDSGTHTHTHAQADRPNLNSSGAKCQMSSGPSVPIFLFSWECCNGTLQIHHLLYHSVEISVT